MISRLFLFLGIATFCFVKLDAQSIGGVGDFKATLIDKEVFLS